MRERGEREEEERERKRENYEMMWGLLYNLLMISLKRLQKWVFRMLG